MGIRLLIYQRITFIVRLFPTKSSAADHTSLIVGLKDLAEKSERKPSRPVPFTAHVTCPARNRAEKKKGFGKDDLKVRKA